MAFVSTPLHSREPKLINLQNLSKSSGRAIRPGQKREEGHARLIHPSWSHAKRSGVGVPHANVFYPSLSYSRFYTFDIHTHAPTRLAGSDTTATALRATMLYILSTTHVLPNLLAEIRTHRSSHPITSSEARSMPYLQATIYEGLRHFLPRQGCSTNLFLKAAIRFSGMLFRAGRRSAGRCLG